MAPEAPLAESRRQRDPRRGSERASLWRQVGTSATPGQSGYSGMDFPVVRERCAECAAAHERPLLRGVPCSFAASQVVQAFGGAAELEPVSWSGSGSATPSSQRFAQTSAARSRRRGEPSRLGGAEARARGHLSFGGRRGRGAGGRGGRVGRNGSALDADLLSGSEVELLLRQCSRRAPTGVRNRALLAVLWRCGLRLGEALALKAKDFDADAGTLVVQRGKGGKRRVVGVDAGTAALVTGGSSSGASAGSMAAPSSARSGAARWTSRTSATCSPGSRGRQGSSAASTPTGCATRSPSTSSAPGRRCTSSGTRSGTRRWRPRRCTCRGSGRTRPSTRCGAGRGTPPARRDVPAR